MDLKTIISMLACVEKKISSGNASAARRELLEAIEVIEKECAVQQIEETADLDAMYTAFLYAETVAQGVKL